MTKKVPKFREFISEEKEEPYRLVILSHNAPDDPNATGVRMMMLRILIRQAT